MTVTTKTASRTLNLIRFCDGSPERALGDCRMQLRALGGYSDRHLEAVSNVLALVASSEGERRERLLGQLTTIANRPAVTR